MAERALTPWVRFTGPLYGDDLWAYLATADPAVAPDPANELKNKLSMIKIFEYMAFGLPLVLFDLVEGRRFGGRRGAIRQEQRSIGFCQAHGAIMRFRSVGAQLGASGRDRIRAGMTWDVEKKELLAAYKAALFRKPGFGASPLRTANRNTA